MDRRQFLSRTAVAGVSLVVIGGAPEAHAVIGCNEDFPQSEWTGNQLSTRSRGCLLFEHYHHLDIPKDLLENPPPQGIRLETSRVSGHSHYVNVSYSQLRDIAAGKAVTLTDRLKLEHEFIVQIPNEHK